MQSQLFDWQVELTILYRIEYSELNHSVEGQILGLINQGGKHRNEANKYVVENYPNLLETSQISIFYSYSLQNCKFTFH